MSFWAKADVILSKTDVILSKTDVILSKAKNLYIYEKDSIDLRR